MKAKIIDLWEKLNYDLKPIAECPCGSIYFHVLLNGFGNDYTDAEGIECVECGKKIKWVKASEHNST